MVFGYGKYNLMITGRLVLTILLLTLCGTWAGGALMPGYKMSSFFGEQVRETTISDGVRIIINAPSNIFTDRPTSIIFYATPNGNSIEQTLGCSMIPGLDLHFDIQHIAAQTRMLREICPTENIILVCMEAEGRSWPAWRQKHQDSALIVRSLIEHTMKGIPGSKVTAVLTGHSGGGSMVFRFINAYRDIPDWVSRIAFLDSNYGYSDSDEHGDKLLRWLRGDEKRQLVVIAYDDREIILDGKKVVSTTGGTFRASHRMLNRFERELKLNRSSLGDIDRYSAMDGRIDMFIHRNPANKILHTALVGEMNGYLEAMTLGVPLQVEWGIFGGPRAYSKWIEPAAMSVDHIPPRPKNAGSGLGLLTNVEKMSLAERESIILGQLRNGNLPDFLRNFVTINVSEIDSNGHNHTVLYQVMPDYLAVGSDKDFVRVPISPMIARAISSAFDCVLPTRKMVDDVYKQAEIKLEPRPLTEMRESVNTFIQHNSIIEDQRGGSRLGALMAGTKKDVVITNMLADKPGHVAIYGWHKPDGSPIQPLSTVHKEDYVDYSHGIRLVKRDILVDGQPRDICEVMSDPKLCYLLSDEGPVIQNSEPPNK